jgi:(E)-4-hydroxy-3-methylbut-2-enyl-diphosphate synthase
MIKRRKTRQILVGSVPVGGDAPISVQSMTNTQSTDVDGTVRQIHELENAGCMIVRVTVPDKASAEVLSSIIRQISIPLVADIHFDYHLALMAVDAGVSKIRINPGNIGSKGRIRGVLRACESAGIPIRIGVNSGSLEQNILNKYGEPTAEGMVESGEKHLKICHEFGFNNVIVALKSSDTLMMIEANRRFSEKYDVPLHLGVTEAGPKGSGTIKSAIGIGTLLAEGIGDTIRVSLSSDPVDEVKTGFQILKSLGLKHQGVNLISCPTCGRMNFDLLRIVNELEEKTADIKSTLTIAVMGCVVNGPGEAREADIGIAGLGRGKARLYIKGIKKEMLSEDEIIPAVMKEIDQLIREEIR